MTIKQYGGVFGRNPTFNDVTIEGQLTFDGDIDINSDLKVSGDIETTGNVIIATSGKGIDFSATGQATGMTSELLDDYEEGYVTGVTMTPSTSGTITMLAAYTTLSYTKVGRIVTITGNLVTSSSSSPVGTSVAIGTLPFTVAAGDQTAFAAGNAVTYYEGGGVYSSTPIRVTESATAITWLIDASTVSGVKELYINLSYVAA